LSFGILDEVVAAFTSGGEHTPKFLEVFLATPNREQNRKMKKTNKQNDYRSRTIKE